MGKARSEVLLTVPLKRVVFFQNDWFVVEDCPMETAKMQKFILHFACQCQYVYCRIGFGFKQNFSLLTAKWG